MKTHAHQHGTASGNLRHTPIDDTTFADDTYEGALVMLTDNSGEPVISLPTAQTDIPYGVLLVGSANDTEVEVGFLDRCSNVRLILKGTCVPGDKLVLADPTTVADAGKVEVGATGFIIGTAEESGTDGQLVLVRPLGINL